MEFRIHNLYWSGISMMGTSAKNVRTVFIQHIAQVCVIFFFFVVVVIFL